MEKNIKKVVILGLILLIIAGLIVVALKGFNVTLMFGKHETIELRVGKEINLKDVEQICKEVFSNKKYIVKELEVFGDSFQVNVQSITDDEKANLISKVNEKYAAEKKVDDLNINSISNKRIRDVIKPYIVPMLITVAISYIYSLIRFKKMDSLQLIIKWSGKIILLEAVLLSIVAVTRIPVDDTLIYIFMIIPILKLVGFMYRSENKIDENNV